MSERGKRSDASKKEKTQKGAMKGRQRAQQKREPKTGRRGLRIKRGNFMRPDYIRFFVFLRVLPSLKESR